MKFSLTLKLALIAPFVVSTPLFFASCQKDEPQDIVADPLDEMINTLDLQTLPEVSHPSANPSTLKKVELGRLLFWDRIVGGHKDVACATCHHPDFGYGDGLDLPIGVNGSGLGPDRTENTGGLSLANPIARVPRNAPTILNSAFNGLTSTKGYDPEKSPMFWDKRVESLEGQCQKPPTSRSEMRGDAYEEEDTMDSVVLRLAAIPEYVQLFEEVFGSPNALTIDNYAAAMSAFERSIISTESPYDKYLKGDKSALTQEQKQGLILFNGKARCSNCHFGPMLSDFAMHCMGIPENPKSPNAPDGGDDFKFRFRTPTLRNVSITGPYMHNGIFTNLKDVVRYMDSGVSGNPHVPNSDLESAMIPIGLTEQEMEYIVAFLESLTDENFDKGIPASVPSGLPVGGNIQ